MKRFISGIDARFERPKLIILIENNPINSKPIISSYTLNHRALTKMTNTKNLKEKKTMTEEQFAKEIFGRDEEIHKLECEIMRLKECEHKFVYSFREQNANYNGSYYYKDIVICEKCGLIKRY